MTRRHNFQNISWFFDLSDRKRLDLNPPYQRRSVWNQKFREDFIDTVLLGFPSPAVFLYEEFSADGRTKYFVVDGKQRISTVLAFASGEFPIGDQSSLEDLRGKYFSQLNDETKQDFWSYQFTVEYLDKTDEDLLNSIFDRINRNVAKLTPQELRHARFDGKFISAAEELSAWMVKVLPEGVPRIQEQSRKQMKDVELTATLLLHLEIGAQGLSQSQIDEEFSKRDQSWEQQTEVISLFIKTIEFIGKVLKESPSGLELTQTRVKNQADFYSLFGGVAALIRQDSLPAVDVAAAKLLKFFRSVEDEKQREQSKELSDYYEAARSASNDRGPREVRITQITNVLK